MRIRAKIFLFIFITSFLVFAIVIGVILYNYKKYSINEANRQTKTYANHAANFAKNILEKDLAVCETLAQGFTDYDKLSVEDRDQLYTNYLKNVLEGHPEYLSVWMSWELRFIEPGYYNKFGRKRTVTVRESGVINTYIDTLDLYGDDFGTTYYETKISGRDVLKDPYYYEYSQTEKNDSILETSVAKPINIKGEFAGLVGIDLSLNNFQKIVDKIQPYENSLAMLLSNKGSIISSSNLNNIGDSISGVYKEFSKYNVINRISMGEEFPIEYTDTNGISKYVVFAPIFVGKSNNPWSVCIIVPTNVVEKEAAKYLNLSILIGTFGILIFTIITLFIAQRITNPLIQTTSILKDLDKGIIDFSKKIRVSSKDEIAEMGNSINHLMETLSKTAEFAKKIGQGDFNAQYRALSEHDVLGNALIDMQKNLQINQEQEDIRQLERRKLTWAQEGLTELGEVLRTSTDNFEDYLLSILSFIIKYVKADQGAIFILNTMKKGEPYLELRSAYAYDKKKSLEARIEIGESLVGRCFQEKEIIYMTNIPEGYTFVSSGLGGHEPRCLFLMPLLFEDEPFGVIELASFKEFADFEIDFLKTIGERVASSISVMEKNVQTKQLLEQYQVQSSELQNREKMLQENFQELQKIQEDASNIEKEDAGIIKAISTIGMVTWYNTEGKIIKLSGKEITELGFTEKELKGKSLWKYAVEGKESAEEYEEFWNDLRNGNARQRLSAIETKKGKYWISEIYNPIKNYSGQTVKIISVGLNVTQQKDLEEKIEKLETEIDKLKNK